MRAAFYIGSNRGVSNRTITEELSLPITPALSFPSYGHFPYGPTLNVVFTTQLLSEFTASLYSGLLNRASSDELISESFIF